MNPLRLVMTLAACAALLLASPMISRAGELTPPGPPDSTFKTLDEVQPGTPISQADMPFTITEDGFYYLVENVSASSGDAAIRINSGLSRVVIDLRGFSISTGPVVVGISAGPPQAGGTLAVRNGSLRQVDFFGIDVPAWSATIEDITLHTLQGYGIRAGDRSVIRRCVVSDLQNFSSMADGITVGADSTVQLCTVTNIRMSSNGGHLWGIRAGDNSRIEDCTIGSLRGDGAANVTVTGIEAGFHSTIARNQLVRLGQQTGGGPPPTAAVVTGIMTNAGTITDNRIREITASSQVFGIVGAACEIRSNDIRSLTGPGSVNTGFGIHGIGGARIIDNTLTSIVAPANAAPFAGILVSDGGVVRGNHVDGAFGAIGSPQQNVAGILINGKGSVIRGNSSRAESAAGTVGRAIVLSPGTENNVVVGNLRRGDLLILSGFNTVGNSAEPNISF